MDFPAGDRRGRLVPRPLRASDAGILTLHAGDMRVTRNITTIRHPLPQGAAEEFIAESSAVERKEDVRIMDGLATGLPELLGAVGL